MSLAEQIHAIGQKARRASRALAILPAETKNAVLEGMADALVARTPAILEANARDIAGAESHGLTKAAIDRLRLTEARLAGMAKDIRDVARLEDPVEKSSPNGPARTASASPRCARPSA